MSKVTGRKKMLLQFCAGTKKLKPSILKGMCHFPLLYFLSILSTKKHELCKNKLRQSICDNFRADAKWGTNIVVGAYFSIEYFVYPPLKM